MKEFFIRHISAISTFFTALVLVLGLIHYFVQPAGWSSEPLSNWFLVCLVLMALNLVMNIIILVVRRKQ